MDRLRNSISALRYGFLCLILLGPSLGAEALAQGTWTVLTIPPPADDLFSVHFVTANIGFAVGANGRILRTGDGGANWTDLNGGFPATTWRSVRFQPTGFGFVGGGPQVIHSVDAGTNWTVVDNDATFPVTSLFATSDTVAWSTRVDSPQTGYFLSRYTVGNPIEENFNAIADPDDQFNDIFFVGVNDGWAVGTNGLITRITNGGAPVPTFTVQNSTVPGIPLNGIHMVDVNTGYIVGNGGTILKTIDGGTNWIQQPAVSGDNLFSVSCTNATHCWAVGANGLVIQTINGGAGAQGWFANVSNTPNQLRDVSMFHGNAGYAVGLVGTAIRYPGPTAVTLESFSASVDETGQARLQWKTGYEVDNLGFNVYRAQGGKRTRITPQILAGSALLAGNGTGLTAGNSYEFADELQTAKGETEYWLEELDLNGRSVWHGPARITRVAKPAKGERRKTVLLSSAGNRAGSASIAVEARARLQMGKDAAGVQAGLARGAAVKIFVKREGWYRVSREELLSAGLGSGVDPRRLQLYVDGREQAIAVRGEEDGSFDAADGVEFYGMGLESAASDTRVYWLIEGRQAGQRLRQTRAEVRRSAASSFPYTVERRDRTVYFASLLNGEEENFFGTVVAKDSVAQTLDLPGLEGTSGELAVIELSLQGVTEGEHRVKVSLNGEDLGSIQFRGKSQGRKSFSISHGLLRETDNRILMVSESSERDVSLVDAIRVTYWRRYSADKDVLRFNLLAEEEVLIDGFSTGEIQVLDITDAGDVQEVAGEVERLGTSFAVRVAGPGRGLRTILALTGSQMRRPDAILANKASSWIETSEGADLVIIAHSEFMSSVSPLIALREKQGYKVALVDVEDIYDEFSYGQKTPRAIRDFLEFAKTNWTKAPRFVLFVGDASLDPKDYQGKGSMDFVPTKLIDTMFLETASDDWFADFAGDGLPQMAIGRLPVSTREEADRIVAKILSFDEADLTGGALLVSDRNDGFDFKEASDELRALLPPDMVVQQIQRGATDEGTEKSRLLAGLNRGQRLVNYLGHGSVGVWRGNFLSQADANDLANSDNLSFFVATTCLNGYFQEPGYDSLAESLMKADGGAFAVWASSGMTRPGEQVVVNKELFRLLFRAANVERGRSRSLTLGEAVAIAKAAAEDRDVRRTYTLFGDPTMKLRK